MTTLATRRRRSFRNESAVKKRITTELRKAGAWVTMPHQRGFSQAGVPDILACYRGTFLSIEVKYNGNVPSHHQEEQIEKIEAAGGIALVLDETNWRLVLLWLQHLGE